MRVEPRAILGIVLGALLTVGVGLLHAQSPAGSATSSPRAGAPVATATGTALAPPAASTPSAAGAAAPEAQKEQADPKKPAGPLGGYSWSDKPARRSARVRRRPPVDANAPLATYPGFRMLPNGTSELVLRISKKVELQLQKASGMLTFVLPGTRVGVRNNTNPLVTTHFDTPLARAHLAEDRRGAQLILELREAVLPTFSVTEGPGGTMLLVVKLPRAAKSYSDKSGIRPASSNLAPLPRAVRPRGAQPLLEVKPGPSYE